MVKVLLELVKSCPEHECRFICSHVAHRLIKRSSGLSHPSSLPTVAAVVLQRVGHGAAAVPSWLLMGEASQWVKFHGSSLIHDEEETVEIL